MLKIRLLHQPMTIFGMLKSGGSKELVSQNWGFYSTHKPIVAGPLLTYSQIKVGSYLQKQFCREIQISRLPEVLLLL